MSEILTSIRRTPYQSMAAFMVLFFTLFLSGALFIAMSFLNGMLGYIETRPQVTAYFQVKTPENDIFKVRDALMQSGKVLSIKYVSKEQAFQIYKALNKDNPLLLEMISSEILPPSLEIFAKEPEFLPQIAEFLKKESAVDEVNFQKDIVDRLLTLTTILRKTTIVFFAFLLLMSIVVLTTTTLFKIALKRDEIELLRLLGATTFYIKKPFLLEGMFFGVLASASSVLLLTGILLYLSPFLSSYLRGIPELYLQLSSLRLTVWPFSWQIIAATFLLSALFGIGIATIANVLATEKYLK